MRESPSDAARSAVRGSYSVLPKGFEFPWPLSDYSPDIWFPGGLTIAHPGFAHNTCVIARLKRGAPLTEAQAQIATVARRLAMDYPRARKGVGAFLVPMKTQVVEKSRRALLLLFAGTALILLIACSNASALLLASGKARRQEMAVRVAMGASRGRLLRQQAVEIFFMGVGAAAAGLAIACAGLPLLLRWMPAGLFIPRLGEAKVDWRVLAFSIFLSWTGAALSGLLPALGVFRLSPSDALKGTRGGRGQLGGRWDWLSVLVPTEVALTFVLMTGAAVTLRSLQNLQHIDLGFNPRKLLVARVACPGEGNSLRTFAELTSCYHTFAGLARRLPGANAAGFISSFPPSAYPWDFNFGRRKAPSYSNWSETARFYPVSPGYFRIAGVQLLGGRLFTPQDDETNSPRVLIINDAMARRYWRGLDPVGQQITVTPSPVLPPPAYRIVGIVRDVQPFSPGEEPQPAMYVPLADFPAYSMTCLLQTKGDARVLADTFRKLPETADRYVMVSHVTTAKQMLASSLARPKLVSRVLDLFAVLALLLAAFGTYGVLRHITARRTHEMSIRIALGARPQDVIRLVVAQGMRWTVTGLLVGFALTLALGRILRGLLYHVAPLDPLTLITVALAMTGSALIASYFPARRAAKLQPAALLKQE